MLGTHAHTAFRNDKTYKQEYPGMKITGSDIYTPVSRSQLKSKQFSGKVHGVDDESMGHGGS